ncbi:pseudouridine synthase pus4 [Coniothyrium glycines]
MTSPLKERRKVLEGIFAIDKPQWSSSAGVLRDLQDHFSRSYLFAPWIESEKRRMYLSRAKPKHINNLKVKLGHGGTLDPMATGVLIVGVGKGTKCLQRFLECTKTYECVVLFGAATDSYDAVGKVVSTAPYAHVTKELVEEKLAQFRGKIMQKPSVFSALKVDGKKMYEYAREGKDIPEVAARPVEVEELELVEWLDPGTHEYAWPKEQADSEARQGAEKLLGIRKEDADTYADTAARKGCKRPRTPEDELVDNAGEQPKKPRTQSEPAMSGALPAEHEEDDTAEPTSTNLDLNDAKAPQQDHPASTSTLPPATPPHPPAARLRMTVTSGFYVRSLCHDLGLACSSLGLMSSLIRSRQGAYSLTSAPPTVLSLRDLESGPAAWEPALAAQLERFMQQEGWSVEEVEVEDEQSWEKSMKEAKEERREADRERSYKGGGGGGGGKKGWRGNGKGKGKGTSYYSKGMNGGQRVSE